MTDIHSCSYYCDRLECIKAQRDELRDRLAQPEQEPVPGVVMRYGFPTLLPDRDIKPTDARLYTAPPQRTWAGLTDEDVMGLCRTFMGQFDKTKFIKATEAKLKEKNT